MGPVDILYIFFSVMTLYFSFLFLMLFARNRSSMSAVPSAGRLPSVSIIVPAHNEARDIVGTLKSLKALDYPKRLLEITVVDDGSTDDTAALARRAGVRVLRQAKGGKARALNAGIRAARSTLVACVDADSYPERDALLKSVPFFNEPKVAAVTTHIFVKGAKSLLEKLQAIEYAMIAWTRKLSEYIDGIYATPGPFSLYRRSVLREIGGFDPSNATEDIEIAWRLLDRGYKIKMSPARTWTSPPQRWHRWLRQRVRWNIGGFQTSTKYRSALFKRGSGAFGFYILPFFTLSYVLTMAALSLIAYVVYYWIYKNVTFVLASIGAGIPLEFRFWPLVDVFVIFGLLMFGLSTVMLLAGLRGAVKGSLKNVLYTLIYLTVYVTIFPFLLVYSIIKYLQGYREW